MQKRQGLIITLTALLTGLTLVGGVALYFVLRSTEAPETLSTDIKTSFDLSSTTNDIATAPVETSAPTPAASPLNVETSTQLQPPVIKNPNISPNITEVGRNNKNFGGVNWKNRDLRRKNLRAAQLGGANLANANLTGVDLSQANFGGANLKGANLKGANLSGTDLRGANLEGADLRGTNIDAAFVDGANLQNTKLP